MHGGRRENLFMAAKKKREYSTAAAVVVIKLLITSVDCDPKAELPFPDSNAPLPWNAIVDALNLANYCFTTRRLADPPAAASRVAFLGLLASKKVAFLHRYESERENHRYRISYDERLMNDLPSFRDLILLPRFHRFTELPEDLQLRIITRLDGVGFPRMRCVSRRLSCLQWSRDFNICMYFDPHVANDAKMAVSSSNMGALELLRRFPSAIFMAAAAVGSVVRFLGELNETKNINYGYFN